MRQLLREFRLIPVVLVAAACLLILKTLGLVLDGGYVLSGATSPTRTAEEKAVPARVISQDTSSQSVSSPQSRSNTPRGTGSAETTGSVAAEKAAEKNANRPTEKGDEKGAKAPPKQPDGVLVQLDGQRGPSSGERAVLERLQERRQELDARAREIEIRENLLKATEKRLEARAAEIKEMEQRVNPARRDEADAAQVQEPDSHV